MGGDIFAGRATRALAWEILAEVAGSNFSIPRVLNAGLAFWVPKSAGMNWLVICRFYRLE